MWFFASLHLLLTCAMIANDAPIPAAINAAVFGWWACLILRPQPEVKQ